MMQHLLSGMAKLFEGAASHSGDTVASAKFFRDLSGRTENVSGMVGAEGGFAVLSPGDRSEREAGSRSGFRIPDFVADINGVGWRNGCSAQDLSKLGPFAKHGNVAGEMRDQVAVLYSENAFDIGAGV